jgi:hypothetical protein
MAKAKKSETGGEKKKAAKTPAPANAFFNTSFAAESAAKLIGAKMPAGSQTPTGAAPKESSAFKQMKQGLNKPAATTMSHLLDRAGGPDQKKSHLPAFGGKQVGRNQTFGADVNRAGVPRRTGGG